MGIITIFRLTESDDEESTVSDKIEFNTTTDTTSENPFINLYEENPTDGVGNNQGAEQNLGEQQALGQVEDIIKIGGFFSQRNANSGQNTDLVLLTQWANEDKINSNWELGRFGITDLDDLTHSLTPVNTGTNQIALLWEKLERKTDFKGNRELFTLYFRVNRGDGT